ncbi:hypothetical protein CYMTET_14037 [Cymbomonas tetramitiformis]|uniref:Tudor domain-containing protein n=1 Tax=Cymbomonas tetramitiformis TaxID=36881 RepID=A0AAE0GH48_9CHLO|nr:hypothetical protein CYMTET_14037 [Cymbomonas tetramitiformis]
MGIAMPCGGKYGADIGNYSTAIDMEVVTDEVAFLQYTSGSTSKPKVEIPEPETLETAPSIQTAEVIVGSKIEVFWKDDACFYPGVVKEFNEDGKAHVLYDDGDEETLDLSEENFKIINSVSELTDEAADADGENIENSGGDYEEYKRGGAVQNFLTRSLCERWRSELG